MSIRVLLVDDQALLRAGFKLLLDGEPDLEVVGQATDGREAIEAARRLAPDVVLMDIRMPDIDGIEATRRILADTADPPRVLILTTFDLDEYVYNALHAGASGFLLKDAPPEQLVAAIHVVAGGDALLAPSVTRRLIEEYTQHPQRQASTAKLDRLTPRERDVLNHLARGLSNAEIAREFVVSETTVKTHVASLLGKLDVRDRVQAVVYAYESGLIQPGRTAREN